MLVALANSVRGNNNLLSKVLHRVLHNNTIFVLFFKHPSITLKMLAVPNKAVFCAGSFFMSISTAATYFSKPFDNAPNVPRTNEIIITVRY